MVNVKGYISSNFTKAFLTIFLPFFLIISLVYLVKISALTAQIQITFAELITLYGYSVPDIIFYTLPISFVAALANVLMKLSQDNELIALYALGLKANKVLRSLLLLGLLFSLLLASISFLAMPLSKQFYKSFKESKRADAKLNIVPGKLGQKFGNYYIYVKEKDEKNNLFHDIVIYNRTNKNEEQFFSSKEGKLYDANKKQNFHFEAIVAYWNKAKTDKKMMRKILFYTFISLIPLLSVYLIAAFTMINPRYQANRSFITIFAVTLLFYMLATVLQKWGNFLILIAFIILLFLFGRWLFAQRVARFF